MEASAKNRLKLWLRSERAFGLSEVQSPTGKQESLAVAARPIVAEKSARMEPSASSASASPVMESIFEAESWPALARDEKIRLLAELDDRQVKGCTRCRLCEKRTNTVFGEGDPDSPIMFVGEGPGETEDKTGRPFVGRAGELLDKQIAAMGFKREQVYIANIVKCRPPGNRQPAPDEAATCMPYLEKQISILQPKAIVTLGLSATRYLLESKLSMGRMRGNWYQWRGIKVMPTFHPAYVLRQYTPETRAAVWSDLKQVLVELKLPIPKKGKSNA